MKKGEYYQSILSKFKSYNSTPIGEGTFGVIYRGFSDQLNTDVAIKIFKKEDHNKKEYLEQFVNEAQKVAGINHRNIIRIYENNTKEFYFVMSLLEATLAEKIRGQGGMLSEGMVIRLAMEITKALCELADQEKYGKRNIVHRDMKPSNIMFDFNDNAVLTDFGIAIFADEKPDTVAGTVQYMSPEQFEKGQNLDSRSDLYSLGVILYQLSTGRLPFEESTFDEMKKKHQHEIPKHPKDYYFGINDDLAEVILKLLEKSPAQRFFSPHALLKKLEQIRKNYKKTRINNYLIYRNEKDLFSAKQTCEEYLKDVDPTDGYFRDELSKVKFIKIINDIKLALFALDLEDAQKKIEGIETSLDRESDNEYSILRENIQIVNKRHQELLSNIKKAEISAALINLKEIENIISNYGQKGSVQKLDYFRKLLSILGKAQTLQKNENYSSALGEYSKAKEMDQNGFDFINTRIEEINRRINLFHSQLQKIEELVEKHNNKSKVDNLKAEIEIIKKSKKKFDSEKIQNLDSIYYKLLAIDGLEYKKNNNFQKALDRFREAQKLCDSESIRINILLFEIFLLEQNGQYALANRNCELLLEKLQNIDDAEPLAGCAELAEEYNPAFLKMKRHELRFKLAIYNDFGAITRYIKLHKTNDAKTTLEGIEEKLEQKRKHDDAIDLSVFDSQLQEFREKIENDDFEETVSTPPSTILNKEEPIPSKPQKPLFSKKIALFIGAIAVVALIVWKGPDIITEIKDILAPKPHQAIKAAYIIESIPANSQPYIDGDIYPLINTGVIRDSLSEGKHTFRFTHPRYNDTSFVAMISKKSENQFTLEGWQPVKIRISLDIEPKPDIIRANGRKITSTTNLYSFQAPPGPMTIEVTKKGFETKVLNLQLEKNKDINQSITLRIPPRGNLRVTVSPNATIYLDGEALAQDAGQFSIDNIAAGMHTLTLRHRYWGEFERDISIQPAQENNFAYNLENECGELFIIVHDNNNRRTFANFLINDRQVAEQQEYVRINKLPGEYKVFVDRTNYHSIEKSQTVKVIKGKVDTIKFTLIKN